MFTAIIEFWHEGDQNYRMETIKRQTRRSAMYYARKALKTGFTRPGYMPECARVEDADENTVARFEVEVGRVVLVSAHQVAV
jgi:hypothetical protein